LCSVPQGCVLGPIQFISYSDDVVMPCMGHGAIPLLSLHFTSPLVVVYSSLPVLISTCQLELPSSGCELSYVTWMYSLTLSEHVRRVTSSCFFQLCLFRQCRKHINCQDMKQLVHAFVTSRLDYCNDIPRKCVLSQLQQVENVPARLVLDLQSHDHMKLALFELHWLPVHFRIESKLCLLMHSATV